MATYLGFSRASGGCDIPQASKIYKELVAMELAVHHFNHGLGTVVPELEQVHDWCPLRFSAEYHDSQYTPSVVVQSLTEKLAGVGQPPCAVVGARTSSSTGPSAIVSGVYGLPQMSFTATSPELSDRFKYPSFARVVPADDAAAGAAMHFFEQVVHSSHVALLYINDSFGNHYHQAFQHQAAQHNIVPVSFPLAFPPDPHDVQQQLLQLQATGVRHILMVVFSSHLELLLTQATELQIMGPNYFWMTGISTTYFNNLQFDNAAENATQAALASAIQGMAILPEFGAKPNSDGYHRFLEAWHSLGNDTTGGDAVDYFNRKIPRAIRGVENCFQADAEFFSNNDTGSTAHFAYDSIISMALGACQALVHNSTSFFLDGAQHMASILNTTFEGASGIVRMDPATASRDPLRFSYAVLNVLPQTNDDGITTFTTPEIIVMEPNAALTDWRLVYKDPHQQPHFIFQDGTSHPPPSLPPITVDMN